MERPGIYIHIPFCEQRCNYCDFFSTAGYGVNRIQKYFDYLNEEIRIYAEDSGRPGSINTIYIGGGTPSTVPAGMITDLVKKAIQHFGPPEADEITIEVNPHSAIQDNLKEYRKSGINRLSIGIQSLDNSELLALDRIHTVEECLSTLEAARTIGYSNISLDLIFGIPGQTVQSWKNTLDQIIEFKPEHISAYTLMLEQGTKMTEEVRSGKFTLPAEDSSVEMFEICRKLLSENGYIHYEISNYSLPEFESIHNTNYWRRSHYKGLGLSAHSYFSNIRYWNTKDFDVYYNMIDQGLMPIEDKEELSIIDRINETILLGLRMTGGFSLKYFESEFGKNSVEILDEKIRNLRRIVDDDNVILTENNNIRLSGKSLIVSDEILTSMLFSDNEINKI
ncbi:MAG: radical SAM family heme chaperone HemW [bacterium]|nr:radical SAM family heme chaperone HemW [bacterium]